MEALRSQPATYGPIRALRSAMREVLGGFSAEEAAVMRERGVLWLSTPMLQGVGADQIAAGAAEMAAAMLEALEHPEADAATDGWSARMVRLTRSGAGLPPLPDARPLALVLDDACATANSELRLASCRGMGQANGTRRAGS